MPKTYAQILNSCVENGRILAFEDGIFHTASVEIEVEYVAEEEGVDVAEAVAFALDHCQHRAQ